MFPSSFIVGMFSKHGAYVVPKKIKDVEVRGATLQDLHDVMCMSINHGETIDDFKKCGKVVVRENFHKHKPSDVWTNYF
jgi:hypothetical protein